MWVQQNIDSMFYYQETRLKVDGGITRQNMSFIFGIKHHVAKRDDD